MIRPDTATSRGVKEKPLLGLILYLRWSNIWQTNIAEFQCVITWNIVQFLQDANVQEGMRWNAIIQLYSQMKTNFHALSDSLIFRVTRRSRSDVSHLPREWSFALTWLMWPLWARIPSEKKVKEVKIVKEVKKSWQWKKSKKWKGVIACGNISFFKTIIMKMW